MTLIFGMEVDLDLDQNGIEGQGRRSKVKVRHENYVFQSTIRKGGQRSGSPRSKSRSRSPRLRSEMKVTEVKIRDDMCMVKVTMNRVKVVRWSFLPHQLAGVSTCSRFH